jgi:hypothetical protein
MVQSIPHVNVTHQAGYVTRVQSTDQTPGFVIESDYGHTNEAVLIKNPGQLRREFGVNMDLYWAAGGGPFYAVRAVKGTAAKATQILSDDSATPVELIKLVAKRSGSKPIYFTVNCYGEAEHKRVSITLEELYGLSEYYISVRGSLTAEKDAFQVLVEKINQQSDIVDAYYKVDGNWVQEIPEGFTNDDVVIGSEHIETVHRAILGSQTGGSLGDDGEGLLDEDTRRSFKMLSDVVDDEDETTDLSPAEQAHEAALKVLEESPVGFVFCVRSVEYEDRLDQECIDGMGDLYQIYLDHINKMNTPELHGWRFAVLGANENMNMIERIEYAGDMDNEMVVFVGQGLVDLNGVEYEPDMAVMAVAGKIAATRYNVAVWGGKASKVLQTDQAFITDIIPSPGYPVFEESESVPGTYEITDEEQVTRDDYIRYNESGVVTFIKDSMGVKIREGITTISEMLQELGVLAEDELSVIRIINHAKYETYDACYSMIGEAMTPTFKTDLEQAVVGKLAEMYSEGAISDYSAVATIGASTGRAHGRIQVDIGITPVHAARIINASIVVN